MTPVILITTSCACQQEKTYILDWVFCEVLGIRHEIRWDESAVGFAIARHFGNKTILSDGDFFDTAERNWLTQQSMPTSVSKLEIANPLPEGISEIPVFQFHANQPSATSPVSTPTTQVLDFDLFGSLFFLLSRYEEAVVETRDNHDRFPSSASVLTKYDLLDRPIGNEYIELLWRTLKNLWPDLIRKKRTFRVLPSHDIDHPSANWRPSSATSLRALRQGSFRAAASAWKNRLLYSARSRTKTWNKDPNDTVDWIMDQSEHHNLTSAFYYIPEKTHRHDPGMAIDHPHVEDQWLRIAKRGHELGLHPGYGTYLSPDKIKQGATLIRRQMDKLGIQQSRLGGRQHFLRWKSPETAIAWDAAGLAYDSTLAFADRAGFRCGVCYEFPMYDLTHRCPLKLLQRPLVVMECTVIDDQYMGLGDGERAYDCMRRLKHECQKYQGDFTILWHNQRLRDEREKSLYSDVLSAEQLA